MGRQPARTRRDHGQLARFAPRTTGVAISPGLRSLLCLRVIQPSHLAFRVNPFQNYPEFFVRAQHDPLLDKFIEHAGSLDAPWRTRREAVYDLCCLLTVQGIALSDVTPGALLHHAHETRRVRAAMPGSGKEKPTASSAAPPGTCCTPWACSRRTRH